ncbi:fluoride efflux transporter FluC [Georgenia subflava]|uniref:Fluoride-specific ion channel FluC n=1 Tax=Georgenia subflava TaxID=1622177 RepID=A0A6N7EJ56_9MICO|nr:CrcB family protein [Georgenia subflava]MPV36595.1 hypothetical protein [Georgenia subflava]
MTAATHDGAADRHPPAYLRPGSWAAVGIGGTLGTLARHGVDTLAGAADALTWSTAAVNLLGAFLLGLVLEIGTRRATGHRAREVALLLAGTGFLGAFTTYSTFAVQIVTLLERDARAALGYGVGLVLCGLLAAGCGVLLGTRLRRGRSGPGVTGGTSGPPAAGRPLDPHAADRRVGPHTTVTPDPRATDGPADDGARR